VGSRAYCAHEVESARDRWAEALATGGSEAGLDVEAVLKDFAAALGEATDLGPRARAVAARVAAELRAGVPAPRGAEIETWLGEGAGRLVAAVGEDEGEDVRTLLAAEAERALAPYRSRLPAKVMARLLADSRTRRLLERHGLPRLSLFHLESRPAASPTP